MLIWLVFKFHDLHGSAARRLQNVHHFDKRDASVIDCTLALTHMGTIVPIIGMHAKQTKVTAGLFEEPSATPHSRRAGRASESSRGNVPNPRGRRAGAPVSCATALSSVVGQILFSRLRDPRATIGTCSCHDDSPFPPIRILVVI